MTINGDTTLRELAFEVCTALEQAGTTAVLSGGGAATLYAPEAIQSFDLDFIIAMSAEGEASAQALEALGYHLSGHHYEHADSKFLVEFPPGPLAIGDELISEWDTLEERGRRLHVLSPTDSCRDRLAAFFHFQDRSALDQAVAIHRVQAGRINMDRIQAWAIHEGHEARFGEFRALAIR